MSLFRHELRQGLRTLWIWAAAIGFLLGVCVVIYPQMGTDMDQIGAMFSEMGSFSAAFGMDKINFGTFMGFFAVECGNILGLGGALYAALAAVTSLSREEGEHTAEFLLTHPLTRTSVIASKLLAVLSQVLLLNLIIAAVTALTVLYIHEDVPRDDMTRLLLAYLLLQLQIALTAFGISAFLRHGGAGIGLGMAVGMYFLNLIANMTDKAAFLKYLTPYAYADGANILTEGKIDGVYLTVGLATGLTVAAAGFLHYRRKDIA